LPLLYPLGDAQGDLLAELVDVPLDDSLEYPDDDIPEEELSVDRLAAASCPSGVLRGLA